MAAALAMAACSAPKASAPAGAVAPSFELDCASSDTATASQLFCVRTDTRNGDVMRVNYDKLPVSNGPTAAAAAPAGRYTTVCDATSTDARSDFYCVRLNVDSGEMMLVNLTKVGQLP